MEGWQARGLDTAPQGPQSGPWYLQTPPPGVGGGETKQPQMTACHCIHAGPLVKKCEDPRVLQETEIIVPLVSKEF